MNWAIIALFIILDIYTLYYLNKSNKELRQEVMNTRKWCLELIGSIVEQEKKIDSMLVQIAKEIYNSDENNERLNNVINNIRDEQQKMVDNIEQKIEDFPGT